MNEQIFLEELSEYIQLHIQTVHFYLKKASEHYNLNESKTLEDFLKEKRKPTFSELLFTFIDQKQLKDSEVYNKAGIDRKHFSKIRSNRNYRPRKKTILSLAIALELTRDDIENLLESAGYSLSNSDTGDLIIQFCLEKNIYNINWINQALDLYGQKSLNG